MRRLPWEWKYYFLAFVVGVVCMRIILALNGM